MGAVSTQLAAWLGELSRLRCAAKNIKLARSSVESEHEKGLAPHAITFCEMAK